MRLNVLKAAARILGLLALVAATAPAQAAEIHVPGDFPTIPEAITAASDGDVIIVEPGTYTGNVNPFGKAITIRSVDPNDQMTVRQTVLDGAGSQVVSFFSGEGIDTVLEGFTITGGNAELGGGIGILASNPTIRKVVVRGNTATQGGGVYASVSSSLFDQVTIADNTALDGGGLYAYANTYMRFDGCKFLRNEATSDGGAISSTFSSLRFLNCLFADNVAGDGGGAFDSDNTGVLFVNSLIRDNVASFGGAIAVNDDNPQLLNTTVTQNTATEPDAGGAIWGIMSQPIIRNSIVRDNAPNELGGFSNNPAAEFSNVEGGLSGRGNIDADPLFFDPANNDFRLRKASPSRNTGFNGWVPSYSLRDLGRAPRILDADVDMGAYETRGVRPPKPPAPSQLVVAMHEPGSLADGLEQPILSYDPSTGDWATLVRNQPAFAIAADAESQCFWVHSSETGLLVRIPYANLQPQEIGILTFEGEPAFGLSGMAARDGVLYGTAWVIGQPDRLYTIDVDTATMTLAGEFPSEFEIWDAHYEAAGDRFLVLSSPETIPPGPLGIYQLDLDTFELTQVQGYFNDDPFTQLNSLQGLATGADRNFLFRAPYNEIEIYDAQSQSLLETIQLPADLAEPFGAGWLFGGLTWVP